MVGSDTVSSKPRALKGRDLITIGISRRCISS